MHTDTSSPRRTLRTPEAALYLGVSPSLLRKLRLKAPDDAGPHGPDFIRVGAALVLYEIEALDRWLDEHRDGVRAT
jgi:hypothetical protein